MNYRRLCGVALAVNLAVATVPVAAPAQSPERNAGLIIGRARGSFVVAIRPESETRYAMNKTFSGAMIGTSTGTMVGDRVVDAYAALERFEGTVDGRRGGFVLLHRGFQSAGEGMNLDIFIAPNSGTGELRGIRGRLVIEIEGGKHTYVLEYSLPAA